MVVPGFNANLETVWIVRRTLKPQAASENHIEELSFSDPIAARADALQPQPDLRSTELLECTIEPETGHVVAAKLLFERIWIDQSHQGEV